MLAPLEVVVDLSSTLTLPCIFSFLTLTLTEQKQKQKLLVAKMIAPISFALLATAAIASPVMVNIAEKREMKAYNPEVTIHESCNSTQRRMLERALA